MFTVTKLFLTALLAISQVAAVGVKFHSLRGCKFSPIDIGCRDLKHDVCCTSKGLSAGSVTFHHAQGRTIIAYGGKNHPQCTNRVYTHRAQGKNTCINGNGSLRAHGASWKNPLTRRELEGGCKGVQEPDVAFIYGNEAVVATGNMTEVDMSSK